MVICTLPFQRQFSDWLNGFLLSCNAPLPCRDRCICTFQISILLENSEISRDFAALFAVNPTVLSLSEKLPPTFYTRDDVLQIAKELLGKYLVTCFEGVLTSGKIVETEAYRGPDDKACHAWMNRRTARTGIMFAEGGRTYVYLCYGIHHLFNIVTGKEDMPHAVLVRAVEPADNVEVMLSRRNLTRPTPRLTAGPGALSQALGIRTAHTGLCLTDANSPIWLEDRGIVVAKENILASPRVGVAYAGECALWDWRFRVKDSAWTSPAK